MKTPILKLLEDRGLKIDERNYDVINDLETFIQDQKKGFNKEIMQEKEIALINVAGGDHIDK